MIASLFLRTPAVAPAAAVAAAVATAAVAAVAAAAAVDVVVAAAGAVKNIHTDPTQKKMRVPTKSLAEQRHVVPQPFSHPARLTRRGTIMHHEARKL